MSDNVFLDTNILVYAHTDLDIAKQSIAQKLIAENVSFISTQVLQELANTLNRKFKHSWDDINVVLSDAVLNNNLHLNAENTIRQACRIAARYGFSFYDSMIISAAIDSNCSILYSEDLQDDQVIDEKLTVKNPFKH
jgi:predicted nucleic acid-binding protein